MGTRCSFPVDGEGGGLRADRFLAIRMPELSRTRIQELIDGGAVLLGGRPVKASRKLAGGEELTVTLPDPVEPDIVPERMDLDILYEDGDVLVVNKPRGLTVHPAPGHSSGTLVNGLLALCGDSLSGINGVLRPGIVHRIDKDTSGALIVCKNDFAHRDIAEQLKEHTANRRYLGITVGTPPEESGTVTGNIGRDPGNRKRMAVVRGGGKPAVTHYRVLERLRGATLCEFRLETGRTHQIRVHMAHIGHPLYGDALYGASGDGQILHAMVIGFRHPRTGEYIECTAPLPEYFLACLRRLALPADTHYWT